MRRRLDEGRLDLSVAVGVRSDECPDEVRDEADLLIDGVPEVARFLRRLVGHTAD